MRNIGNSHAESETNNCTNGVRYLCNCLICYSCFGDGRTVHFAKVRRRRHLNTQLQ